MRNLVFHMQTTLDNRIANGEGGLWEPFPWGQEETAHIARLFRAADTWVLGRTTYEAIVPYWDTIAAGEMPEDAPPITEADREFAAVQKGLAKVVLSTTLPEGLGRVVVADDVVGRLAALKRQAGGDILLSCGPRTLGPIAAAGLVDEYLLSISPVVLADGPRVFDAVDEDVAFDLVDSTVFDGGAVILRYRVLHAP